ncbi:MAG: hypothetical protein RBS80_06485 [Thermoguttaceae bacterium]|jgi:predicted transcriptional regulator|nr:hypothetical protein [Thermoguttaceae bacterium]
MSHSLTIQLNDEVFCRLQQQALARGTSPEELAAASLEQQCGIAAPTRSQVEVHEARKRFERRFGEIDLGQPCGVDNESIDADLAREYADRHEAR